MKYKVPVSVLVVVHTPDLQVLLLERADHPGYWQSVTGSQQEGEALEDTAIREIFEETGLDVRAYTLQDWKMNNEYEIFQEWRWRYAPGITLNAEHVFSLLLREPMDVTLAPREHLRYEWLPYDRAAEKVFSWTNAAALRALPDHMIRR
ncbi:MAG: dihydroneopterin triphosphate diphosphatase [Burkholderiales bacterium]